MLFSSFIHSFLFLHIHLDVQSILYLFSFFFLHSIFVVWLTVWQYLLRFVWHQVDKKLMSTAKNSSFLPDELKWGHSHVSTLIIILNELWAVGNIFYEEHSLNRQTAGLNVWILPKRSTGCYFIVCCQRENRHWHRLYVTISSVSIWCLIVNFTSDNLCSLYILKAHHNCRRCHAFKTNKDDIYMVFTLVLLKWLEYE